MIDQLRAQWEALPGRMTEASQQIDASFGPALRAIFKPTNQVFDLIPEHVRPIVATECAVMLFQVAIVAVLFLRPEYVNVDRPHKSFLYDLRLWTILSMLPHMFIYRFF